MAHHDAVLRNNILAYSWPSHVLSYLRLVTARKAAEPRAAGLGSLGVGGVALGPGGAAAVVVAASPSPAPGSGIGGPPGCHGSPGLMHLRTAFSLSYDDLSQINLAAGGQVCTERGCCSSVCWVVVA